MSAEIPDRWRDEDCWPPPALFDYVDSDDSVVALPPDPVTIRSQIVPTSSGLVRVARDAPPLGLGAWYRQARKHGWSRRKALRGARAWATH